MSTTGTTRISSAILASVLLAAGGYSHAVGQSAPPAKAVQTRSALRLQSDTIEVGLNTCAGKPCGFMLRDRLHGTSLQVDDPFRILMRDGSIFDLANLRPVGSPAVQTGRPDPAASRRAAQLPAKRLEIPLQSEDGALRVDWSLVLVEGTSYVRQIVKLTASDRDLPVSRIQLIDMALPDAHVAGTVDGSPIVAGHMFFGFEHPMAHSRVTAGRATASIDRDLPLRKDQSVTYSAVMGVAHDGQMRRDFLGYLETERAHPYRTFLHYNSWYDLGFFNPYDQAGAVDRIQTFGRELTEKRGVKLDSFLFDDGWDNHASLWKFNNGFPNGFTPVKEAAEKIGAEPGIWMSPWGGYDKPKQERIAFGKSAGYDIVAGGYALSGPRYYAAFRDVCLDMIRRYGVNQFKFDGTGNANSVVPGSQFDSDFAAAIHLIGELRTAKPDLFVNVTTGTWPSPFWLLYADSTWRGGEDNSVAGVGPYRERWITYRDAATYRNVVQNGLLYPLNSLMLHGIIYAQHHDQLSSDPQNDFRNEVRSYFGTGTQLQEMYITPSLLSQANWDDLAEAAKWSRSNAETLKDTHWIGGDPAWLQVYGWASWSRAKGIIVLRNPADHPQSFSISLQQAFELPQDAAQRYVAKAPWKEEADRPAVVLDAQQSHEFKLGPFEVLTLKLTPQRAPGL